ncbi:hypothetical protein N8083_00800 [Candidatus Pacebacteria bacterium]|nr:hypothetical protein [Candidatus Paceibacterota bacterium]
MGKRGPKPKGRVDTVWRPELAYAVGLITADGSLSKNGRHINFTSKDLDLIKTFQGCLGLEDIKIGKKISGYTGRKDYYQIQFGDVLFYKWLQDVGLEPNKSLIMSSLNISCNYFFDFVRGEWDGDGTIVCCKDLRWKNSYMVSMGFVSGSEKFLIWLQKEINFRLHTTGHIQQGSRALQLRYARKDSKRLFDAMFYEKNLPHLNRKFAKAQKIFKMTGL